MNRRDVLDINIEQWGVARGIVKHATPLSQANKTLEEVHELIDAINDNDRDALMDAIGDIYVTLIMQCSVSGLDIEECIERAYEEIKYRKGTLLEDGTFVKDEANESGI